MPPKLNASKDAPVDDLNLANLGSSMDERQRQMVRLLMQNPQSLAQLGMVYRPTEQQGFVDSASNADMFGLSAAKRLLGMEIDPNTRVSEDFGALRYAQQQRR